MSVWDQVVGQGEVVHNLSAAVADPARMTHAWLFTGPPGSGRSVAARAFAAALQCETDPAGCGECNACRTVMAGSHPDIVVAATSETFIRVSVARELAAAAARRPTTGRYRILIVEDADRLNDQAADALLKALEEPPPRTVWLLCAPSLEDLLVTVRSRCRHVRLRTPAVDVVAQLLHRRDGIEIAMAHYAARAAQSHVGMARRLARDEVARSRRRDMIAIPAELTDLGAALSAAQQVFDEAQRSADSSNEQETAQAREALLRSLGADPAARTQPPSVRSHLKAFDEEAKRTARRRQHDAIDSALTDLSSVYRDALMLGTGAAVDTVNTDKASAETVMRAMTPDQVLAALEQIGMARARLIANGSPLLVLEAMMVALILPRARAGTGR